jgi:hypothetical protein
MNIIFLSVHKSNNYTINNELDFVVFGVYDILHLLIVFNIII